MHNNKSKFSKNHCPQNGGGFYDKTINWMLPNSKNKLRDGERHAILYTKTGFQPATFMGPGSHVMDKIKEGVKPVSKSDKTSLAHDLRYSLAKDEADIRKADVKMVKKLDELQKNKEDYKFNILMGKLPIKAKMWLADKGIANTNTFTTFGDVKDTDRPIAEAKLTELEMEGYGKKCKKNKSKWMAHVSRVRADNPSVKYKDILKLAKKSYVR